MTIPVQSPSDTKPTAVRDDAGIERLKALTDGVFAIAMTLLVLDLVVPASSAHLGTALRHQVPTLLSVVLSFALCGVFWYGHRNEFLYIERIDHTLIWINITFLLFLSLIPFSAALLGRYPSERLAVQIYGVNLLAAASVHFGIWWYATRSHRLIPAGIDAAAIRVGTQLALIAPVMYVAALAVSLASTSLAVVLYVLVPVPYISGVLYRRLGSPNT